MNHSAIRIWAFVLLAIVGAYGIWSVFGHLRDNNESMTVFVGQPTVDPDAQTDRPTAPAGRDLRFFERSGREFKLSEMDGKLWVASFFFTACPGECKILNNEIAKLRHEFKDRDVTFVSFTCDPANDTLEELRKYAEIYSADPERWLFVRGDLDYLAYLGITQFKVSVQQKSHSDRMILIKPDGAIEDYYSAKQPADMLEVRKALDRLSERTSAETAAIQPETKPE